MFIPTHLLVPLLERGREGRGLKYLQLYPVLSIFVDLFCLFCTSLSKVPNKTGLLHTVPLDRLLCNQNYGLERYCEPESAKSEVSKKNQNLLLNNAHLSGENSFSFSISNSCMKWFLHSLASIKS